MTARAALVGGLVLLYDRFRATATRLVNRFDQAGTQFIDRVLTPNPDPRLPPAVVEVAEPFPAVVRGVSADIAAMDPNLVATDLQVVTDVVNYTPSVDDVVRINEVDRKVIRVEPIPAVGDPCAWRFYVR